MTTNTTGPQTAGHLLTALLMATAPIVGRAVETLQPDIRDRVVGDGRLLVAITLIPFRVRVVVEAPTGELRDLLSEVGDHDLGHAVAAFVGSGLAGLSSDRARLVADATGTGHGRLVVLVDGLEGTATCGLAAAGDPPRLTTLFALASDEFEVVH
jgi:hypothetical protein